MSIDAHHLGLSLKIEHRAVADLRPLGRQARRHPKKQMDHLTRAIAQFGFLSPVLIDDEGAILAGLARIEAAQRLGYQTAPTITLSHLTAAEKRAWVLAENRISELGEWDKAVLGDELRELATLDLDFSLDITGFETLEIEAISLTDDDDCDEPGFTIPDHATTRSGDVIHLGVHKLICGDSTQASSFDSVLDGEQVQAIACDLPYNVPIRGHVTSKDHREFVMASGEMTNAEFTGFLVLALTQLHRVLVKGGLAYLFMDWRHAKHLLDAAEGLAWTLINICIWDKGAAGLGSPYRSQHEMVFVFKKDGAPYRDNIQLGRHGRDRSNVWYYKHTSRSMRAEREAVPTPKPVVMIRDIWADCTAKGEIVLDGFAGGGSALIAAERIGRRARLIEADPRYCDVIIRRWEAATGRQAVLAATGQTFQSLLLERQLQRITAAQSQPAPTPARVPIPTRPSNQKAG